MQYKIQPYDHQLKAIEMSKQLKDMALFWEMGTGKTKGMIEILRHKYTEAGKLLPTLILAPVVTLENWKREFLTHSTIPESKIFVCSGTGVKRHRQLKDALVSDSIIIINYEALVTMKVFELLMYSKLEIIVMDESHYLKNHKSKRAKRVQTLASSPYMKHRYLLTGTPILNSPMDMFQQYRILDGGETFGKNFYAFRGTYFYDKNANWKGQASFANWQPISSKFPELSEKIYRKASRVTKAECLDLPPLIKQTEYVAMSKDQAKAYKEMKDNYLTFVKDTDKAVLAQLAVTKLLRLQQIVSGFMVTEEGESLAFDSVPRLDRLRELVEEITPNHKLIIWCSFKKNYEMIATLLEELDIRYVMLTGEQNTKQKQEAIDEFQSEESNSPRVVIANRRSGGIGVNLTRASYSIVYSRDFNLGDELQSEARNHRGGSEIHDKIVQLNLCVADTVDEAVLEALNNKQKISDIIVDLKI